MAGFDNDNLYAGNVDFRGVKPVVGQVTTDGQLLIGATASPNIRVGSLTSGDSSVTITNGAGTIALSVTGGTTVGKTITGDSGGALAPTAGNWNIVGGTGISTSGAGSTLTINSNQAFTWTDVTGATQALSVFNGYATDRGGGVVYTLPATAAFGDEIRIVGKLGLATITPNANQQILIAAASGTVGVTGTAVATNAGDCLHLRCTTGGASTVWRAENYVGNWTLN